ncbi:MAG TPA: POTRA domain-containing protein [Patescibacteria group bacterium]|nr:POTRA domain-containing protein [Patescibacteria group bacterium]
MRTFNVACVVCAVFALCVTQPCGGSVIGSVTYAGGESVSAAAAGGGSYLHEGAVYSDSLLRTELSRLDSLLFSYGLLAAAVTVDTVRTGERIDMHVGIGEGERAVYGDVAVSGSTRLQSSEIVRLLGTVAGDPFDPAALGSAMQHLLLDYNEAGYPYAQVWLTGFAYRPESNRADLSFSVFEGDRATIADVRFDGLAKTDTAVALRTARLRTGAVYSERAVKRSSEFLRASGLFQAVGDAEVRRGRDGTVDVVIPVTEMARSNRFQGAFGFSRKNEEEYILNGSAEVELRNIAGTARDAMFSWLNDGQDYSRVEVKYREPFLFSSPVHFDIEVQQVVQDTIYTWHSGGLYLTVPLGPDVSIVVGAAGDRNVSGAGELLRSVRQRYRIGFERWGGNSLNVRAYLEGAYKRSYLTGGRTERDGQFLFRFEGTANIPTVRNQSVFCRLFSEAVFSPHYIPSAERYPLGGARTLRGYRENQFRGERIFFTNLEYRLGGEGRLFVFDDVGWFYRDEDGWDVKNGVGFGLRSASPLGVIELSFGVGDRLSLEGTRIHISLQESF